LNLDKLIVARLSGNNRYQSVSKFILKFITEFKENYKGTHDLIYKKYDVVLKLIEKLNEQEIRLENNNLDSN